MGERALCITYFLNFKHGVTYFILAIAYFVNQGVTESLLNNKTGCEFHFKGTRACMKTMEIVGSPFDCHKSGLMFSK